MNLPNKLTIARVLAVPVFVAFYLLRLPVPACIIYVLACFTDTADGYIARHYDMVSNFGKIMDPLADKVLVYSAFCLFIQDGVMPAWMLMIILAREFVVAGVRTVAASDGIVIAAAVSGKIKTILQMIAVPLMIVDGTIPWRIIHPASVIFLWASLIMTVVSGIEYVWKNKQVFRN